MKLRGGTVGAYLRALRDAATVPGATEHTLRPPLVDFLHAAAHDLELKVRAAFDPTARKRARTSVRNDLSYP